MRAAPDFDKIARLYRCLEYASLGPLLDRVRTEHLERLGGCRRALVLGDGDGRFTAGLLNRNTQVQVLAIDLSERMLALLRVRCGPARLQTIHADARGVSLPAGTDLVVTHFLLDCLAQQEVDRLVERLAADLEPGGLWLVSEFRVPGGWLRWPATLYIRTLYLGFRLMTGLHTTRLPDHETPLGRAGLERVAVRRRLGGVLTSELWCKVSGKSRGAIPLESEDASNPGGDMVHLRAGSMRAEGTD